MEFEDPPGANCLLKGDGGNVKDLPVIKDAYGYTSAWRPSREDLKKLLAGAPIYLSVFGSSHPPVLLAVGDPAEPPSQESITRQPLP